MEEQAGPSRVRKKRKFTARIPPVRVKRVMQADEEIGRMTASVPVVLGRAMEHFVDRLLQQSAAVASQQDARTLSIKHMKEGIHRSGAELAMLRPLVEDVPLTPHSAPVKRGGRSAPDPGPTSAGLSDLSAFPFTESTNDRKAVTQLEKKRRKLEKVEEDKELPNNGTTAHIPFAVPLPPPIKRPRVKEAGVEGT